MIAHRFITPSVPFAERLCIEMEVADEVLKAGTAKLNNGKEAVLAYVL